MYIPVYSLTRRPINNSPRAYAMPAARRGPVDSCAALLNITGWAMGHLQYRGIIMYKAHSASTIFERDDKCEAKPLVLSNSTGQRLITASSSKALRSELNGTRRVERSVFYWGRAGTLLGAMWGLIFDTIVLPIPGISADRFAGPLASWIAAVIQDAIMFGCASALCAGLLRIAMRKGNLHK